MDEVHARSEYVRHVAEQLTKAIRKAVPERLGAWPKAGAIVGRANAAFHAAAAEFMATGEGKDALIEAGLKLKEAWLRAAKAFEGET